MGDRVPPPGADTAPEIQVPQNLATSVANLRKAAEFLNDNSKIFHFREHYLKYRRYADIQTTALFNSLSSLYGTMFISQYHRLRRVSDAFNLGNNADIAGLALGRIYISIWFMDLYVSNREAVSKLSPLAFNQYYSHEVIYYSKEYDAFLSVLLGTLKPTHIKGALEDALYIPLLAQDYAWELPAPDQLPNPFGIPNFNPDLNVFNCLMAIMKESNLWNVQPVPTNSLGRPWWLFDFHSDNRICAWFPAEDNYNDEDIAIAYILGVACTQKLAPRDVDDWVFYPNGIVPNNPLAVNDRATDRAFYGSYEVRTVKSDQNYYHAVTIDSSHLSSSGQAEFSKKRKTSALSIREKGKTPDSSSMDPGSTPAQTAAANHETLTQARPRYKITDWTYYELVAVGSEAHTRTGALRTICLN
jgi:hypothetical protein